MLNDRPTLTRRERDTLRAILHNCAGQGWRTQTRDRPDFPSWLRGRISYAAGLDPAFGRVLLDSYEAIDWS